MKAEETIFDQPIIQNTLQQYPENEWDRVIKALTILGIQSLNNSPQQKQPTIEELEQLTSTAPLKDSQQLQNNEMIVKEEEEIITNQPNKDIEQHIVQNVQENEIKQSTPKNDAFDKAYLNNQNQNLNKDYSGSLYKSKSIEGYNNNKQPVTYNYQNVNVCNSYVKQPEFKRSTLSYSPQVELNSTSPRYSYRREEPQVSHTCSCYHHHHHCGHSYCCHHHCYDDCVFCRCYCTDCILRRSRRRLYSSTNPSLNMNYSATSYTPSNRYGASTYQMA